MAFREALGRAGGLTRVPGGEVEIGRSAPQAAPGVLHAGILGVGAAQGHGRTCTAPRCQAQGTNPLPDLPGGGDK